MSENFVVEIISPDKLVLKSDTTEVTIPTMSQPKTTKPVTTTKSPRHPIWQWNNLMTMDMNIHSTML